MCCFVSHTIQDCKKMAGQTIFEILLLNDRITLRNKNKNAKYVSFWEKALLDPDWPKFWLWKKLRHTFQKSTNGTFKALQMMLFEKFWVQMPSFDKEYSNLAKAM